MQGEICAYPSLLGGSLTFAVLLCREIRVTPRAGRLAAPGAVGKVQPWGVQQSPGTKADCSGSADFCPAARYWGISDLEISSASLRMQTLQMELLLLKVL